MVPYCILPLYRLQRDYNIRLDTSKAACAHLQVMLPCKAREEFQLTQWTASILAEPLQWAFLCRGSATAGAEPVRVWGRGRASRMRSGIPESFIS